MAHARFRTFNGQRPQRYTSHDNGYHYYRNDDGDMRRRPKDGGEEEEVRGIQAYSVLTPSVLFQYMF